MSAKVSDYILQRLQKWGVEHVFGYAGDGIMAVFEAVGYAKLATICGRTAPRHTGCRRGSRN